MGEGHLAQDLKGCIIVDLLVDQHAAMAMARIFTETDIGCHHQLRRLVLKLLNGLLNDAVFGMGP